MLPYVLAWALDLKFGIQSALDREDEGQGMVEYALILVLVSVVAIAILGTVGGNVKDVFQKISDGLTKTS